MADQPERLLTLEIKVKRLERQSAELTAAVRRLAGARMPEPLRFGRACECTLCEQRADEGWVATFRDLADGAMIELTADDEPNILAGKTYRLTVQAEELP